ncbi:phosphoribosylformylglycinamidine synthase subunit PurL [Candidatus Parcubacteria bacterium]|nr:MAG: phosphoribosylformylglycinamidine synthase subunit PurL [Candidatus Parcubacteria bacterium]
MARSRKHLENSKAEILQRGTVRRIAVSSKVGDARARHYKDALRAVFPEILLEEVDVVTLYTIDATLTSRELEKAAARLTNPIAEVYSLEKVSYPTECSFCIEIGYLPGVTDNVGKTARETIEDAIERKMSTDEAVFSSTALFLTGTLSKRDAEKFSAELHNPLIERASVYTKDDIKQGIPLVVPKVRLEEKNVRASEVNLNVSEKELARIGKEGIANTDGTRRGPLALSLHAMKAIRAHFKKLKRNPTDVELECLAQTWSEHCKHTIFNDPLDEIKEGIYRRYIKGATEKIRRHKGKKDFCVSVFKDNSGAIEFDDKYLVTHKVETHNAPSALDPFGGSVTAIVGVNRDCLGFGLGAKPIANVYGFCVADPTDESALYRDKEKNQPLLPARRILEGVVKGINAGGNQSGIPTPLGFVAVDPSYRGKPLVFGGTVGLIPKKANGRKLYEKKARVGDYIVMLGGRVGLDGIHGATFSSESLSKGSPATAVQIGDPITQKKLSDALIREARDKGLYNSITDNGAGGLSGAVGEMAKESGGCLVDLEKVPLKYAGLAPWQIWLSESQERMTLAVPKQKWPAFKKIMDRHDVEATRIGTFTKSGRCIVKYRGERVMELGMEFLHEGRPIQKQKSKKTENRKQKTVIPQISDLRKAMLDIIARPSVGSTAFIAHQYDHEVQGSSVTKPTLGKGRVNADAAVLQPLPDSSRGIVLSHGYAPWYSVIDTYTMAAAAIDTAIRNAVCAGASLEHLAILDNFCWSSSDKPERLYQLKRAAESCYDTATMFGTPFISGKDSMFNDFRGFTEDGKPTHIAALPTLLVSAIGVIPDVARAMTMDFKQADDPLYLIGETKDELGSSEYANMLGVKGGVAPTVDTKKTKKVYEAVENAIKAGLVASAVGIGRGGLGVALAKSAIAGQLGAEANLSSVPGGTKAPASILFSESQGRVLVSVRRGKEKEFETLMHGIPHAHIGKVSEKNLTVKVENDSSTIPVSELTEAYTSFFKNW